MPDPRALQRASETWLKAKSGAPDKDSYRAMTAAQNCSVTAAVSSVTFQPFVSAVSLANLCSALSICFISAYGFQSALDSVAGGAPHTLWAIAFCTVTLTLRMW